MSLLAIETAILECNTKLAALKKQYEQEVGTIQRDLTKHKADLEALRNGIDIEAFKRARKLIYIKARGKVGGVERAKAAVIRGCFLKNQFIGFKDYGSFLFQECDCKYGYGPKHGRIVSEIGLTEAAREVDLTDEQKEDCLYALNHSGAYADWLKEVSA